MERNEELLMKIYGQSEATRSDIGCLKEDFHEFKGEQKAMWRKIDSHSKWINMVKGVMAIFTLSFGAIVFWFKSKFQGN